MKIPVTVPNGKLGDWAVEDYEISQSDANFANMRAAFGHPLERTEAGVYKRLTRRGAIIMSNTPMEVRTNWPIIYNAKGHVLLNGLGLGMVLTAILPKKEVKRVTVIEKHEEVIKLVAPHFARDKRVEVIHADALTFMPPRGARFDCAWHDIWENICEDNLPEMEKLHRKYGQRAAWQESWAIGWIRR